MIRPTAKTGERSQTIDILRALAVVMVLGRHMDRCPADTSAWLHQFTNVWVNGGWAGVDLFFVLSGFLVSSLLFREHARFGTISLKSFIIRRGFKIYPAFWLLTLTSVTVFLATGQRFKPLAVPSEFLFIQNYGPALWNHTWSLAVEEHFYIFLVLLLLVLTRQKNATKPFGALPIVFATLAIVCLVLRLVMAATLPRFVDKLNLYPTHLRMDSLFAGVFISYLYHTHLESLIAWVAKRRLLLFLGGLTLFSPAFWLRLETSPFLYTFGLTSLYVGAGLLLLATLELRLPRNVFTTAIAYVGSHSYSIYLWHMPVALWLMPWVVGAAKAGRNWFAYLAVYVGGAILWGIIMANLLEFPLLRLRDRIFPSRAR